MQHQWQYSVAIALAERAEELSTLPLDRLTGNWEEERATVLLTLVFQKALVFIRERERVRERESESMICHFCDTHNKKLCKSMYLLQHSACM